MSALPPLFVYGTLRDPARVRALLGRTVSAEPAVLLDFALWPAPGFPYPLAVPSPGRQLEGAVLVGVGEADYRRLDEYEDVAAGRYARVAATARLASGALRAVQVYRAGPCWSTSPAGLEPPEAAE